MRRQKTLRKPSRVWTPERAEKGTKGTKDPVKFGPLGGNKGKQVSRTQVGFGPLREPKKAPQANEVIERPSTGGTAIGIDTVRR